MGTRNETEVRSTRKGKTQRGTAHHGEFLIAQNFSNSNPSARQQPLPFVCTTKKREPTMKHRKGTRKKKRRGRLRTAGATENKERKSAGSLRLAPLQLRLWAVRHSTVGICGLCSGFCPTPVRCDDVFRSACFVLKGRGLAFVFAHVLVGAHVDGQARNPPTHWTTLRVYPVLSYPLWSCNHSMCVIAKETGLSP